MPGLQRPHHRRRTPATGVHFLADQPSWIFLTVCSQNRSPWLAQPSVNNALCQIWKEEATAWLVSDYLLMPDHLHLFCAPHDHKISIERWIGFWKDRVIKTLPGLGYFQKGAFHRRLRDNDNYSEKWRYVLENPVRKGLISTPEDWPFKSRVHDIRF